MLAGPGLIFSQETKSLRLPLRVHLTQFKKESACYIKDLRSWEAQSRPGTANMYIYIYMFRLPCMLFDIYIYIYKLEQISFTDKLPFLVSASVFFFFFHLGQHQKARNSMPEWFKIGFTDGLDACAQYKNESYRRGNNGKQQSLYSVSPSSPFPEITIEMYYYHERKPWNCILYNMIPSDWWINVRGPDLHLFFNTI